MAGPNWNPPGTVKPKGVRRGDRGAADLLNELGSAAARANKLDFGRPGLHTQSGFYSTEVASDGGSTLRIALLRDALMPGTYDLPGTAIGTLMSPNGNRLEATGQDVEIVNYSTSIYGPIGGVVYVLDFQGLLVAIGSSG